jgi:putative DNA primase/helicase
LPSKLRAESEGILAWLVRACLEWQEKGLCPPEKVRQATADYRDEMDPIGEFIASRCVKGPDHRATTTALYADYMAWCGHASVDHSSRISKKEFATRLEQKGFDAKKTVGVMMRRGIGLKPTIETGAAEDPQID